MTFIPKPVIYFVHREEVHCAVQAKFAEELDSKLACMLNMRLILEPLRLSLGFRVFRVAPPLFGKDLSRRPFKRSY